MSDTPSRPTHGDVLNFWLKEVGPAGWYRVDPEVDASCAKRFGALVDDAIAGGLSDWEATPESTLALLLLLDQFTRNIFRDSARAFAGDARALEIAARAVEKDFDLQIPEPERSFFYLPFEHSEDLSDQDRAIALFEQRMPDAKENIRHAHLHRELIVKFGRFPHRNAVLGRTSTPEEQSHLDGGGYQPGATPSK